MNIVWSWLKDYIDLPVNEKQAASRLSVAGLEVERIAYYGVSGAELEWDRERIVIAQILEVRAHPKSEKLLLVDVEYGRGARKQVLTGAPNLSHLKGKGPLKNGPKGVLALEGARLYDPKSAEKEIRALSRATIAGTESDAMLCSEKELGLSDDHAGVILLDDEAPLGRPAAEVLGDIVLEIAVLPNNARAASVLGVARELAALFELPYRRPDFVQKKTAGAPVEQTVEVRIDDARLCARYTAAVVRGVVTRPSPWRIQHRLRLAGQRPINNIVDVSNYVMFDIGQPIHTFDYQKLLRRAEVRGEKRPKIIVRPAKPGETIVTLDGAERALTPEMLLIADTTGAVAIAGVMGGLETEADDHTVDVLIEAASFEMISVRKTSNRLRLPSEASARFGRNVAPVLAGWGSVEAANMIVELAGGAAALGIVDAWPQKTPSAEIRLNFSDVRRSLGFDLPPAEVRGILERLEFHCRAEKEALLVRAPEHRLDCQGAHDLIEELGRVYGYDRMPRTLICDDMPPQRDDREARLEDLIRDRLAGLGLAECVSYIFTTAEQERELGIAAGEHVTLANPISDQRTHLRRSLLVALLPVVVRNARYAESIAVFELGRVYHPVAGNELPNEPRRLAVAMTGARDAASWHEARQAQFDFFDLKGVLEELCRSLHLQQVEFKPAVHPTFFPGRTCELVLNGRSAGIFGELHPLTVRALDLGERSVLAAELDADALISAARSECQIQPVAVFPSVAEDLAFIVDSTTPQSRVAESIARFGGELLKRVELFDLFSGEQLGSGKKQLAYHLTYQAERNLTDAEIAAVRTEIVQRMERELGARLRG